MGIKPDPPAPRRKYSGTVRGPSGTPINPPPSGGSNAELPMHKMGYNPTPTTPKPQPPIIQSENVWTSSAGQKYLADHGEDEEVANDEIRAVKIARVRAMQAEREVHRLQDEIGKLEAELERVNPKNDLIDCAEHGFILIKHQVWERDRMQRRVESILRVGMASGLVAMSVSGTASAVQFNIYPLCLAFFSMTYPFIASLITRFLRR